MFHRWGGLLLTVSLLCAGPAAAEVTEALYGAAKSGDADAVRSLARKGADCNDVPVNDKPKYGYLVQTPMELAAIEGHSETVGALLDCGAKPRWDSWFGMYAATWAAKKGHADVIRILLDKRPRNIDAHAWFGPAMLTACLRGSREILDLLLEMGLDPNWHTPGDHFPRSCLVEAARGNRYELFPLLLDAGADPDGRSHHGEGGPLLNVAQGHRADLVKLLLDAGADPHVTSSEGNAVSRAAVTYTHQQPEVQQSVNETVQELLKVGVDPNLPFKGRSPLWYARKHQNQELAQMLEAAGGREFETLGRKMRQGLMGLLFMFGSH